MSRHTEPLNGGLWTAADPGVLKEGQLQDARNCYYLAGSQSLVRAPGRAVFGAVSGVATAVVGLRDVQFDNGDHYLIAMAASALRYSAVADSGTFTDLTTLSASGTQLDAAHFQNRFFLFSGASAEASAINNNTVVYLSATATGSAPQVRQHGMLAVIAPPTSATAAATFSQTVTGYYEYWTTEVAKTTANGAGLDLEGTFNASPVTVYVSSTGIAPIISMPAIRNSITTHYRVYRSPKKDSVSAREFPVGFRIAELPIATAVGATASVTDTLATASASAFPTLVNTTGPYTAAGAQATALKADDGVYAPIVNSGTLGNIVQAYQGTYGFAFGGFSGNIRGIEVEFQAFVVPTSGPVPMSIGVGRRIGSPSTANTFEYVLNDLGHLAPRAAFRTVTVTATASPGQTLKVGSPTDVWSPIEGPQFNDGDFTSASWMVAIGFTKPGTTVDVDYVKCTVYYGATVDSTDVFPTVVYTFGDITSQVGKNGPPPNATVGDLFEDSLVVNDVSNASIIRYSYSGLPESFPETYFLDFETPQNDQVRGIKVVNDQLVVLLDTATYRVNYLPSERDASFDRGKAIKAISSTYGCIHPMCYCVFSPGGGVDLLTFVSDHGIHATDGFNFETYTSNLNWRKIMDPSSVPIALVNDRERRLLLFYFRNDVAYGAETFLCLPLSYGEGHWINDNPKVCGLIHMRNTAAGQFASLESAWTVSRGNGLVSTYLGYGGTDTGAGAGKVWIESSAAAMPATDPRWQATTRKMFLAGYGNEWECGEVYGYASGYDSTTPTISYTAKTTKTNDTGDTTRGTKTITLGGQVLHKAGMYREMCESLTLNVVATATGYAQDLIIIDGTGFGLEDSGR